MSSAGTTLVEAPQQGPPITCTPKVSGGGGAVLNPEASVFHLPPTPGLMPTSHAPTINGYHTHVYPLMNGDVGKQYCGVCPHTPDTPGPMAVESPVEPCSSSPDTTSGTSVPTSQAPVKALTVDNTVQEMAAAGQSADQEGNAKSCTPLGSSQQNGEVSPESSRPSASPLPASVPTTDSSNSSATPESVEKPEEPVPDSSSKDDATTSETQGTQTTPAQTPTPSTPTATPPAQPPQQPTQQPTRDQIQQMVAQQVEYVFSRENLSNDPYLISQMDSDQYVPVYILANCSQFKSITKDHSIILEALKESPFVQLDEENNRVRPNYKRCIVILREIPESTPVEEIEAMFKSDECPKVISCEFVHNSSWYVTFESDEDAQKAYWYLRGVVKTFKDKPILARIKTKPVSRLGCLSVLPSYGNKNGEGKEGPAPSTPGPAGMPGGPGTPAPNASYSNPGGVHYMDIPAPSTVTANSYTYPYTTPAAFFYPNMVQWTTPGGFYDINGFLQFNGLSPTAAFKPPSNHVRYNRRNSKHRDGRYEKGDNRHNSGAVQGGGNSNSHGNHQGHFPHYPPQRPHPHHRPQSSQSPSQSSHRTPQPPASTAAPPPPPPPPPPQTSAPTSAGTNNQSFAQCDLAIASQSNLYTSFSPPTGPATPVIREKKEVVTVSKASSSSSPSPVSSAHTPVHITTASPPFSSTSMLNSTVSTTTMASTQVTATSSAPAAIVSAAPTTSTSHPAAQQHQTHGPPQQHHPQHQAPGPPHRNNYNNDHYHGGHYQYHPGPRDPQQRQLSSRNVRRRPRGREEETQTPGIGRGNLQRGGSSQPPSNENTKPGSSQEATPPPPPPQPQFDLEAAAFPPLPGSDEQVPVTEEKKQPEPMASAWGSDTHRFSDVMKGTAKPRAASQSSVGEKDMMSETSIPSSSTSPAPSTSGAGAPPVASATPTSSAATTQASQTSSTTATIPSSQDVISTAPTTVSSTSSNPPVSSISSSTTSNVVASSTTSSSNKVDTRPVPREQRGGREDKRTGSNSGMKDRRDYARDHQRDYSHRDSGRPVTGRDRDHRLGRETNTRTGKENRPVPTRQWKEEKVDADGWITKGPRDSRAHREMNREQRERQESRDVRAQHLVNGDSSPPPSPKPQKTETKACIEEGSVEETKPTAQPLNNNDGEHKTSWAKMALASKDYMERLAAELKEKEEQEKNKKFRLNTRPQAKPQGW